MTEFHGQDLTLVDPSDDWEAVTPDNMSDLPRGQPRWLYVGTSGDLTLVGTASDDPVTFKGVAVGYHPLRPRRVMSTGTDADDIVACY